MIIVNMDLMSVVTGKTSKLGLILIDNQRQYREGRTVFADYRVRAYPKSVSLAAALSGATPHRVAFVTRHPKHSKPVWNLMLKALKELGYENT